MSSRSFGWGGSRGRRVAHKPPPLELGDDDLLIIGTTRQFSAEQIMRFRQAWNESMRGPRPRAIVLDPDMFVAARMRRAGDSYSARFGDCG